METRTIGSCSISVGLDSLESLKPSCHLRLPSELESSLWGQGRGQEARALDSEQ